MEVAVEKDESFIFHNKMKEFDEKDVDVLTDKQLKCKQFKGLCECGCFKGSHIAIFDTRFKIWRTEDDGIINDLCDFLNSNENEYKILDNSIKLSFIEIMFRKKYRFWKVTRTINTKIDKYEIEELLTLGEALIINYGDYV